MEAVLRLQAGYNNDYMFGFVCTSEHAYLDILNTDVMGFTYHRNP